MKITFLGTGTSQGVPVIACECEVCQSKDEKDKRLRSSILIEVAGKSFCVDAGPDFRQQLLVNGVKNLNAILFTHEHKDHTAGLDDVRAFNFKYKKDFPVYGEERVFESLKKEFQYIFSQTPYPGIPRVTLNPIENKEFEIEGVKFLPIRVMHRKLPIFGYRHKNFAYITDANFISEEEKEKLKGLDVLVLNAVRIEPHTSHYNLEQALEVIAELKPKKAYLTHLSHLMGLHEEVSKKLPQNVELAYDGLVLEL